MEIRKLLDNVRAATAAIEAAINEAVKDAAGDGEGLQVLDVYTRTYKDLPYIQLQGPDSLMKALAASLGAELICRRRPVTRDYPYELVIAVDEAELLMLIQEPEEQPK